MTARQILIGSFFLIPLTLLQSQELPPAQDGFHWQRAPEIKGAFLVPDRWHFKMEKEGATIGYFVTRENTDSGSFLVGLTANIIPKLKSYDAVAYMNAFMQKLPEGKTIRERWDVSRGPLVGKGLLFEDDQAVMHELALANPKTNTLYLFMFEAPLSEWDDAWQLGKKIMDTLVIDDEM